MYLKPKVVLESQNILISSQGELYRGSQIVMDSNISLEGIKVHKYSINPFQNHYYCFPIRIFQLYATFTRSLLDRVIRKMIIIRKLHYLANINK